MKLRLCLHPDCCVCRRWYCGVSTERHCQVQVFNSFEPHDRGCNKMDNASPQRRSILVLSESIAHFANISLTLLTNLLNFQSFKVQLSTHRIQVIDSECVIIHDNFLVRFCHSGIHKRSFPGQSTAELSISLALKIPPILMTSIWKRNEAR